MCKSFAFHCRSGLSAAAVLLFLSTVSVSAQTPTEEKPFKRFSVYKDKSSRENHYVPSGYMPTGECLEMKDNTKEGCKEGKSCIKVIYDVNCSRESRQWAGIYWLSPADNWGDRKGGYNLTGAKQLVFWARGEKGGEQIAEFKVGGIGTNRDFPDTDSATIGPVILSKEWRQYEIDLRGKDLSYISGGFAWTANTDQNEDSCTFFLDDIRFE